MSRYYFFSETDVISGQLSNQAFGPIAPSGGYDQFRVVSLHSSVGNPKAIAVCKSEICIQEVTGSTTLVNLILKPIDRPQFDLPCIDYYIYKGVLKSSLITGGMIEQSNQNDLTNSLNAINARINQSLNEATDPPGTESGLASENTLGIHLNATYVDGNSNQPFLDTDPISNLFSRNDSVFSLPIVESGWHIGDFDPSQFGFMVVVNNLGYKVPLKHTRELDTVLKVSTLSGSPSSLDTYNHYREKDNLLSYLDPAAFFGSFYYNGLWAKNSAGVESERKKDEIYDDLLKGPYSDTGATDGNFYNRNTIYLDIRNEHYRTINFQQNYGENISIGYGSTPTLSTANYYMDGWPLFRILNAFWPTGNTGEYNEITLKLPVGDNPLSTIVISQGFDKSLGNLKALKDRKRFKVNTENVSGFTEELELYTPNASTASDTRAISSFIRLLYGRNRVEDENWTNLTIPNRNYLDNLFPISDLDFPFPNASDYMIYTSQTERFIEDEQTGLEYVANIGISKDTNNFYFFTTPIYRKKRSGLKMSKKVVIPAEASESQNSFLSDLLERNDGWFLSKSLLSVGSDTIEIAEIKSKDINLFKRLTSPNNKELLILAFDQVDYLSIKTLMNSTPFLGSVYLSFKNKELLKDDLEQPYTGHDIYLTGYIDNAGIVELTEIETFVKAYNYDR